MSGKIAEMMQSIKLNEELKKRILEENEQSFNRVKEAFVQLHGAFIDVIEKNALSGHEVLMALNIARVALEYQLHTAGMSEGDIHRAEDAAFDLMDSDMARQVRREHAQRLRDEDDEMLFDDEEDDEAGDDEDDDN